MTMPTLLRCVIVSVAVAVTAPIFTFVVFAPVDSTGSPIASVPMGPATGGTVVIPEMRQLSGIEKYRYIFSTPFIWEIYLRGVADFFFAAFVASVAASAWNGRKSRVPR